MWLDCVSTWTTVSLLKLSSFLLLLSLNLQHRQTASCGLSTARATRQSLCRVDSTAFLAQWSCLAGEHHNQYTWFDMLPAEKTALYSCVLNTVSSTDIISGFKNKSIPFPFKSIVFDMLSDCLCVCSVPFLQSLPEDAIMLLSDLTEQVLI